MSQSNDTPNEGSDTENRQQDREATWDEATSEFEAVYHDRKTRRYELEDGYIEFEIRMLTPEEHDEAEGAATKYDKRRDEVTTDTGAVKDAILKYGIEDGPEGFKNTKDNRSRLPPKIRNDLVDAIEDFSEIPDEVEKGFTTSGGGDR